MEDIKFSDSFIDFADRFELKEPMKKVIRTTQNRSQMKSMLSFVYKPLIEDADISFDGRTCVSYHNVKFEEHPKLGKIALVYIDEN